MALCLANSLIIHGKFNPYDQLLRYKWWYRHGYMSSTGECFDIGAATKQSLEEFERRQVRFAMQRDILPEHLDKIGDQECLSEFDVYCSTDEVAGNGALMRLAPIPLFFYRSHAHAVEYSGRSGQLTHGDRKAYDACRYYGALIIATMLNYTKEQLLDKNFYAKHRHWFGSVPLCSEILDISQGSYRKKNGYDGGIRGKGYIISALEAALWAFWSDEDSFEKGALAAVNLGDDTDTTAAIYGQLAGAYYGFKKLPRNWLKHLYAKKFILNLSGWIYYEAQMWQPFETIASLLAPSRPQIPTDELSTDESKSSQNNLDTTASNLLTAKGHTRIDKQQSKPKLRAVTSDGACSVLSWRQSNPKDEMLNYHSQPEQMPSMEKSDSNRSSVMIDTSNNLSTTSESNRNTSNSNQQHQPSVFVDRKPPINEHRSTSLVHRRSPQPFLGGHKKPSSTSKTSSKSNGEVYLKKMPSFSSSTSTGLSCKKQQKIQKSGSTYQDPTAIATGHAAEWPLSTKTSPTTYGIRAHGSRALDASMTDMVTTNDSRISTKKSMKTVRAPVMTKPDKEQNVSSDQLSTTDAPIFQLNNTYADRSYEQSL